MSMTKAVKTLLTGVIASFALLAFTNSKSLADTQSQTLTPTATSSSKQANLNEQQISQTPAPAKQTQQESNDKGCGCCKKMMDDKKMTGTQHNQPR